MTNDVDGEHKYTRVLITLMQNVVNQKKESGQLHANSVPVD